MKKSNLFFIVISILFLCNFSQKNISAFSSNEFIYQVTNDTTVYSGLNLDSTAELQDAINYFRNNNKYKDWKEANTLVVLRGIVEKDGTITGVKIRRSSNVEILDKEALRLIKSAKYNPGTIKGKTVRSDFDIVVRFPAQ